MIECRLKTSYFIRQCLHKTVLVFAPPLLAWFATHELIWVLALSVFSVAIFIASLRTLSNPPFITFDSSGVLILSCRPCTAFGCLVWPRLLHLPASELDRVTILQPRSPLKILSGEYACMFESRDFSRFPVFIFWCRGNSQPYYQRLFGHATNQSELLCALQQRGVSVTYE